MWKGMNFREAEAADLINSDFRDLSLAATKLANHAVNLGVGFGFGASFFGLIAAIAAIYLLVLDRTNWKTNILTGLLIPYIFFSLPSIIFNVFRGEIGKWIALVAIVLRIFIPKHFPDWLELPAALIILIVVAPGLIANTFRDNIVGVVVCLVIACYLLQEHIRASGGFRNSFTKANGVSNSIGIIILLVYPIWAAVVIIF
ncbi:cold-regulated 413 plasma membrane protein 1 [Lotus japonicus]|uniref:Uncharacterized protein n=1 Tax=Lotus japonicus TaxID=34305 RepID=I3SSB3_LOTJA|nr:cold-regulated 413 plasma membrane protein 1 [Lotus japonicus]AFK43155.1 unknown [Lotus japonicus]